MPFAGSVCVCVCVDINIGPPQDGNQFSELEIGSYREIAHGNLFQDPLL